MAKQKTKTNIKRRKVVFSLNAPKAKRVAVLGISISGVLMHIQ